MLVINPREEKTSVVHSYLLGAVAPRPIAFASTVDSEGNPNLSPFSFFNCFGARPPVLVFSPARRVRDNTVKHTLENIQETGEVVINVVNYSIVQQASLSSVEYPRGVNEFVKAGFTPVKSDIVKPFRVKESPVQMECKVLNIVELGKEGGAGNLIICEVVLMHISEDILDENKRIDPHKIDLVARMGGDLYCRASGSSVFEVEKPNTKISIGVDSIPARIRLSHILSGNNLGQLGNVETLPSPEEVEQLRSTEALQTLLRQHHGAADRLETELHRMAKDLLEKGQVSEAWKTLLISNN
jgi:flavin reductase (DIM6/NTAB) family NADH-FMN oxidoreductase RutF